MGTQLPLPLGGTAPNFRPMSVVAKRLDGLRCHLVWRLASAQATLCLMGTHLPQKKGTSPPYFWPMFIVPNGWMDQDATWYRGKPRPRRCCVRRGPSSPARGAQQPPLFGPCVLWPRSPILATAELLFTLLYDCIYIVLCDFLACLLVHCVWKKCAALLFASNFAKCWPIFNIFSSLHLAVNSWQSNN